MEHLIRLVGPNGAVEVFGVKLVGVTAENGMKLLLTVGFIAALLVLGRVLRVGASVALRGRKDVRSAFWARQGVRLTVAVFCSSAWPPSGSTTRPGSPPPWAW